MTGAHSDPVAVVRAALGDRVSSERVDKLQAHHLQMCVRGPVASAGKTRPPRS